MIHLEEAQVTQTKAIAFTCSKCGTKYNNTDMVQWQESFTYSHQGGWGSLIGDGVDYRIDLCQNCFIAVLGDYIEIIDDDGAVSKLTKG